MKLVNIICIMQLSGSLLGQVENDSIISNDTTEHLSEFYILDEVFSPVDQRSWKTEDSPNTLLIYVYSDGTTEKVFRVE